MELIKFILLGVVQGLTEFLPVSSSGHLVIFQQILPGFDQPGVVFEAFLHAGTLFSVVYFFKNSIFKKSVSYWLFVGIATIPAILVGLFFNGIIEILFSNLKIVGIALLVTGILNYATTTIKNKGKEIESSKNLPQLNIRKAFLVGIFQALAIVPGISRSGSTIFAGRKLKLSKKTAAEFSFLMSLPAVIGANVFEFINNGGRGNYFNHFYFAGFIASFISGIVAISIVLKFLEEANYKYFSYYTFVVGLLVIVLS
jgi:undecaprenyl-diphosphatase